MAKTQFQKGTPVTKEWLNAISNPVFDGADEDGHHPPIADSDLSDAPGQVKDRLTTAQTTITAFGSAIADKADQSALTALQTTVGGKANQSDLTALQSVVNTKADAATAATKTELNAKANQSDLTALQATVNTKADTTTAATKTELSALTIDSSKIASGVIDTARIPNLDASKITTGTLSVSRIPDLPSTKITGLTSGGAITQALPPSSTTNSSLGALIYATSNQRLYICTDATPDANTWRFFGSDGSPSVIARNYPGGTLSNGVGANTSPNKSIADQDILWHIGTNQLTTSYTNPIDGSRITQTNSGVESAPSFGSPVVLADRSYGTTEAFTYASLNQPNSFFTLDFGASTRVLINRIAIQQRGDYSSGSFHRTLQVSYSSDGSSFTASTNFTASTIMGGWSTFDVTNYVSSRYFRVTQTSLNNTGSNYFIASEILLYGTITYL